MSNLTPPITPEQTDAKSPIDQDLTDAIRLNLEKHETDIVSAKASDVSFRVNGVLSNLSLGSTPEKGIELDGAFVSQKSVISTATVYLAKKGDLGTLEIDIRRLKYLARPISGIQNIFTANTDSIARGSGALLTQSITKAEGDLGTLSVTYSKATISVESIVQVTGAFLFRINLATPTTPLDEDYAIGKYIFVNNMDAAGNNGVFEIKEVNKDNGKNLIVENLAGVEQITPGGNIQLLLVDYTFITATPLNFAVGEKFVANGHIDPTNDGTLDIYKTNILGNNLQVFRTTVLVPQVGAGGQCETLRYQYNYLLPVVGAFAAEELVEFTGHTDVNNNGSLLVKAVNNNGGNNVVVYNELGVLQGSVIGEINTNRFVYALDSDPDGFFKIGDTSIMAGHDNALNNGNFVLVDVKYLTTNNIVIYNAAGVEQLAPNGTCDHSEKAITFRTDYSDDFEIDKSNIIIGETFNAENDGEFLVRDINRTAVSPYNIICELTSGILQDGDDGQIVSEVRSIFTDGSLTMDIIQDKQIKTVKVSNSELVDEPIAEDTILLLDVLQVPENSANLAINIK